MKLYMKFEYFSNHYYNGLIEYYKIVDIDKSRPWRPRYTFIENGKEVKMSLYKSDAVEMTVLTEDEYLFEML